MDIGNLDIHLKRRQRAIEDAAGRRPRLPGNLRQLGAVGAVTKPGGNGSQQVLVKVTLPPGGGRGTRQQLTYLQHQKGHHQSRAPLYGPGAADPQKFAQAAHNDPHQFRIIVSTKEDTLGDQRSLFIQHLVRQMERDLGRELEWVAANHYDTPYAHTHVVIRGGAPGEEWYMSKAYFEHGIRDRAAALLTRMLGQHQQEAYRYQSDQAYTQERLALNGMLRGGNDPDMWHLQRQYQSSQAQQAQNPSFSVWGGEGAQALRAELTALHQRTQALQMQQAQWHQSQRRER